MLFSAVPLNLFHSDCISQFYSNLPYRFGNSKKWGLRGGLWLCCTDPWDWNEIVHQLQVHMTHWIGHFLKTLLHSWISSVWFIWYRHLAISLVPHTKKKQSQLHKWAMRCNKLNVFILFVSHEISHLICRYGEQRKWNER